MDIIKAMCGQHEPLRWRDGEREIDRDRGRGRGREREMIDRQRQTDRGEMLERWLRG